MFKTKPRRKSIIFSSDTYCYRFIIIFQSINIIKYYFIRMLQKNSSLKNPTYIINILSIRVQKEIFPRKCRRNVWPCLQIHMFFARWVFLLLLPLLLLPSPLTQTLLLLLLVTLAEVKLNICFSASFAASGEQNRRNWAENVHQKKS